MTLRPKIVKLIDKYSQKRGMRFALPYSPRLKFQLADLVTMNETFVKARSIFDQMMEESLARHSQGNARPLVVCS